MFRLLRRLFEDEYAGSTVEWLLVSTASVLMFSAIAQGINLIIWYLFTRGAIVISTPFG